MDPLQETFCCQLSQIAPDGVLGKRKLLTQVSCDHLPGSPQDIEDVLFAMTGEHKSLSHETARDCMFFLVWVVCLHGKP
jgi:hypothetical protein